MIFNLLKCKTGVSSNPRIDVSEGATDSNVTLKKSQMVLQHWSSMLHAQHRTNQRHLSWSRAQAPVQLDCDSP